uniref:nostrin isoform X3 n=1 Tax=Odobenus rosmarus divergens TaxID=9708 RepID=UPI00063C0AA2|nr:PREDICTED: nostrin isoform X3 [Odobenus rosmarus divergens]
MRDPLTDCSYNKVYKNLKEFSQNGENFCKQVTSILQQRANLEINYAKGLQKLAIKLSKALQSTKKNCLVSAWAWVSEGMKSAADLHQKLGKAIELEAIKPTHQVLSVHEKKRKSLDNEVEKAANLVIGNWNQQIKAKKKLMISTKKHEALSHLVESSRQTVTKKEKQKLLSKLKKSTEKLAKEDENYYQKNLAGCATRLKWENTLENCYQEEDLNNAMNKERQESSLKSKLLRLQKDIEKASRDQEGLERMLKSYPRAPAFSDAESQKITAALMDETNLKLNLLQANSYKLSSVLAELEQRPQPSHPCSNSIFKWKEKQQTHSYIKISRPFLMKRLESVVSRTSSGGQRIPSSSSTASGVAQLGSGLCKALYSFQARQDDELNLEKGDIVTIYRKQEEGWWFGSLNGKKGHFPAAYVEELPSNAGNPATQA